MLRNLLGLGMILNTEAFQKGQQAARDGRPETDNPFITGQRLWLDWKLGWRLSARSAADNENRSIVLRTDAQSPFEMGRAAAMKGVEALKNPFHYGHPAHAQWRLGWASVRAA